MLLLIETPTLEFPMILGVKRLKRNYFLCFSHNTESTDWCHPLEKAGAYLLKTIHWKK